MAENNHLRYIVGVNAFIVHNDRYLIIERAAGDFAGGELSTPGGGIETGDYPINALEDEARREIREEVCVEVGSLHYLYSTTFMGSNHTPICVIHFICEYDSGTVSIGDPDEVAAVAWMTRAEILSDPRTPQWLKQNISIAEKRRLSQLSST